MGENPVHGDQYEVFLKLFRKNEKRIYVYILSAVANRSIAEDIMQETMLVMWRKFVEFELGTKFSAWGYQIARFLVLDYYRKKQSDVVRFDSYALEKIMDSSANANDIDDKSDALHVCMKKLPEDMQKLIRLRYAGGHTIKQVAEKVGKPIHGMYKHIAKIHFLLQGCIEKTLAAWKVD
jgi:RNA polymerase sigma-70 factor (ECF subfamily)